MKFKNVSMLACAGTLIAAGSAQADFIQLIAEQTDVGLDGATPLADLGMPENIVVFNLYAEFSDPTDQLVGIVGNETSPFVINTSAGGWHNDADFDDDRPPSVNLANAFPSLNWDSFFTIGNSFINQIPDWDSGSEASDQVNITPGFAGPPSGANRWMTDEGGWVVPPSLEDPGEKGDFDPTPQTVAGNWAGDRVLFARLAVDTGAGVGTPTITGSMKVLIVDGEPMELPNTPIIPAPGALALLGLAGLAGTRRRRG